jgi:hypothetical protein
MENSAKDNKEICSELNRKSIFAQFLYWFGHFANKNTYSGKTTVREQTEILKYLPTDI